MYEFSEYDFLCISTSGKWYIFSSISVTLQRIERDRDRHTDRQADKDS